MKKKKKNWTLHSNSVADNSIALLRWYMQHTKTYKLLQSFFFKLLITNVFWFCLDVYWLFKDYRVCFDSRLKKRCSPSWQGRRASRSIIQLETLHSQSRGTGMSASTHLAFLFLFSRRSQPVIYHHPHSDLIFSPQFTSLKQLHRHT